MSIPTPEEQAQLDQRHAADTLLEYIERREQVAAQRERAAIVAWLRSVGSRSMSTWPDGITFPCGVIVIDLDDLALIERGEHLRSDDE